MKLSKAELLEKVKTYIGDRTDDESIELIEDISDSVGNNETDIVEMKEEYENKLATLDETWRKKYTDRFFSNNENADNDDVDDVDDVSEKTEYSDLFNEKEI